MATFSGCKKSSICLDCKKSVGLCSWSREFEPVDGWEAKMVPGNSARGKYPSYLVTSCPEFESDEENRTAVGYLNGKQP